MKVRVLLPLMAIVLIVTGCTDQQLQSFKDVVLTEAPTTAAALTNDEVIGGLKEALTLGAEKAANLSSQVDGYYKNPSLFIVFPEEANKVAEIARDYGLGNQVDKFEMTLNRAAEDAAKEAAPIFVDAVKNMTIADGFNILQGGENAATNYLREKTTAQLKAKFEPIIASSIAKVELTKHWEPLINKYNIATLITGGEEINPDLEAYVLDNAIKGLFVHIEAEEKNIRQNPQARVTDLLQKVFAQ